MLTSEEAERLLRSISELAGGTYRGTHDDGIVTVTIRFPEVQTVPHETTETDEAPKHLYRALHIDTEGRSNDLLRYYLRNICNVAHARSMSEAVRLANAVAFDYILVDTTARDESAGLDLIRRLRKSERTAKTAIVAIAPFTSRENVERWVEAGSSAFLTKPYLKDDLLRVIKELEPTAVTQ